MMNIPFVISREMGITESQVNKVIEMFEEGATVPFIARYRKEHTGGLDEDQLRVIEERQNYLTILEDRKETVLKSIEEQGKLTDELRDKIIAATKLQEVEDLYLPYKPKRKTRGTIAKAKGLEPLALFMLENYLFEGDFDEIVAAYVDPEKGVNTPAEALQGAQDIIAEMISDTAEVRQAVREFLFAESSAVSKKAPDREADKNKTKKDVYETYHEFKGQLFSLKPYQILALNRGERDGFLRVSLEFDKDFIVEQIYKVFIKHDSAFEDILRPVADDSFTRLIFPSVEREVRAELTEKADLHAIEVFAANLRQLLLQPPIHLEAIMGIDPGFVSGSKIAIIDKTGKYLDGKTIYPHPPQNRYEDAKKQILQMIVKYNVGLIAIGNGTASRETEFIVAELINESAKDCRYLIVNEAGASVYSASEIAKQEFPDLEASQRGNISIARRVLDPLSELVKIDPKSIGVGLYQHDVDQKLLAKKLDDVVVSCVNYVGVDLNTSSAPLLTYVSGLNRTVARRIIDYRDKIGGFTSREELMKVAGLGDKMFEQCAGFLKISDGINPLDNTFIHPESYEVTKKLLAICKLSENDVKTKGSMVKLFLKNTRIEKVAAEINAGVPTLNDIIENLSRPGRDPREDMPKPILRSDVLKMEDLQKGMRLKGTVRNIVDFGAFVDIGVKQDGLLHISRMAGKFIKNPLDVLKVADVIEVTVIEVDPVKGRISLSMKD